MTILKGVEATVKLINVDYRIPADRTKLAEWHRLHNEFEKAIKSIFGRTRDWEIDVKVREY